MNIKLNEQENLLVPTQIEHFGLIFFFFVSKIFYMLL